MSVKTVTSLTNATVKAVRALHMRKEREDSGLFLAEGLKIVIEAIDCGHAPKILMYGPDAADHPMLQKAAKACAGAGGMKPARFRMKPIEVPQISGLRATSRHSPTSPCRASIQTETKLAKGTAAPTIRPIVAMPGEPKSMPATASAMYELKR